MVAKQRMTKRKPEVPVPEMALVPCLKEIEVILKPVLKRIGNGKLTARDKGLGADESTFRKWKRRDVSPTRDAVGQVAVYLWERLKKAKFRGVRSGVLATVAKFDSEFDANAASEGSLLAALQKLGVTPAPAPKPQLPSLPSDGTEVPVAKLVSSPAEFCRLVSCLLVSEAVRHGVEVAAPRVFSDVTAGFTTGVIRKSLWGLSPDLVIEFDSFSAGALGEPVFISGRGDPVTGSITHFVIVTPAPLETERFNALRASIGRGVELLNYHQPQILEWLRRCRALLARYYPGEAARRTDAAGFDGRGHSVWQGAVGAKLVDSHRKLELFGFPVSPRQASSDPGSVDPNSFKLEDVFVPQKVRRRVAKADSLRDIESLVAEDCTARVLLGEVGSGKSSMLHYLAIRFGEGKLRCQLSERTRLPLFLSLRTFALNRTTRPTLLEALAADVQVSASLTAADTHPWHLEALLAIGDAVVFFDGLDEVGDVSARKDVCRFIEAFHREYPLSPVWVTSRLVGYDGAPLDAEIFEAHEVAPFGPDQQLEFIGRWHERQLPGESRENERRNKVGALVDYLKTAATDVREMAGNPLLLTMMVWVNHHLGHVPPGRGRLYHECVELFVHRRDKARYPGAPSALEALDPPIRPESARRYYSGVAYFAHDSNQDKDRSARGEFAEEDAIRWLREALADDLRSADGNAADAEALAGSHARAFLEFSEERSGLLRILGVGRRAFIHLSVQEFLAAEFVAKFPGYTAEQFAGFLEQHLVSEPWREVLLLLLFHLREIRVPVQPSKLNGFDLRLGKSVRFADWFADRLMAQAGGVSVDALRLLGMAIRDRLEFNSSNVVRILESLAGEWIVGGDLGDESAKVLGQVHAYAPEHDATLRAILRARWEREPTDRALAALHLEARIFGWPTGEVGESAPLTTALRRRLEEANDAASDCKAARLLSEAGVHIVELCLEGKAGVAWVRDRLQERMLDVDTNPKDRAASGTALGTLGDLRPGVAPAWPTTAERPFFDWCDLIPADTTTAIRDGKGFVMGGDPMAYGGEEATPCPITAAYRLARYPVTNAQYAAFVRSDFHRRHRLVTPDLDGGPPNHPVVNVSWIEAVRFCEWLTDELDSGRVSPSALGIPEINVRSKVRWKIRLPAEVEWERAARHTDGRLRPWTTARRVASDVLEDFCNCASSGIHGASPVGAFPLGEALCQALDLIGNVWEWCANEWSLVPKSHAEQVISDLSSTKIRVLRGGSWANDGPGTLSATNRYVRLPDVRDGIIGFRAVCVGESR